MLVVDFNGYKLGLGASRAAELGLGNYATLAADIATFDAPRPGHAQPPRPRQDQLRDRISRSAERSSRATPFLTSTPSKLSRSIHTRITQSGHP